MVIIILYLLPFIIFIFIYYLLYLISLEAKDGNCEKDFIAKEYTSANSKGNTIPEHGNHQSRQVPQSHLVLLWIARNLSEVGPKMLWCVNMK